MGNLLEAMDKKQITVLVLLDLSKAFDSIDHARLLYKLSIVGALPSIVIWFKGYLSSRYQYVRIGSTHSDTSPINHGVHQGPILSPLLFCIYLNDLPLTPSSNNLESYIDDSKLFLYCLCAPSMRMRFKRNDIESNQIILKRFSRPYLQ